MEDAQCAQAARCVHSNDALPAWTGGEVGGRREEDQQKEEGGGWEVGGGREDDQQKERCI